MKKSAGVRNDLSAVETKSKARRQNTFRLEDEIDSDETVLDNPTEVRRPDMDVDVKRQRHVWKRSKRNRTARRRMYFYLRHSDTFAANSTTLGLFNHSFDRHSMPKHAAAHDDQRLAAARRKPAGSRP